MLRCMSLARSALTVAVLAWVTTSWIAVARADPASTSAAVVCATDAPFAESLAAKEIRRYVYLRTGKLLPLVEALKTDGAGVLIVVGCKDRPIIRDLLTDAKLKTAIESLAPEQYLLRTIEHGGRPIVLVAGGDSIGTLYGAYRLTEHFGVRFYLHGDVVPDAVKKRLKAAGKDPADPAVVQHLYEGIFQRIIQTHPLDYYWFWTPETWTWQATKQPQIDATLADFRAAIAAAEKVHAPFTLATCDWVLGPVQDRALFDNVLPKRMPMNCINREVGHAPVEPGFAQVQRRPKWAIPWLEDDGAMIIPQLWAGRMRKDAADALAYGCTGLLGIHWRTRILGPNVAALAKAAWDQHGWNPAHGQQTMPAAPRPPEGPEGGKIARFPTNRITGTDEAPLYQSVRYDVGAYCLDVPNGKYTVVLKFCEPHYGEVRKRVFGVKLQGQPVIDTLDIFRKVGKNKALDYTFKEIEVTDGRLTIEFLYQSNPLNPARNVSSTASKRSRSVSLR